MGKQREGDFGEVSQRKEKEPERRGRLVTTAGNRPLSSGAGMQGEISGEESPSRGWLLGVLGDFNCNCKLTEFLQTHPGIFGGSKVDLVHCPDRLIGRRI